MSFTPGITTTASEGRIYAIAGQALYVLRDGGGRGARLPHGPSGGLLYFGDLDGEACFARAVLDERDAPAGTEPVALRQLFGVLSDEEFGVAGRALGLATWERDHRFCGRCGNPTERDNHERVRTCTVCQHGAYPKLSPAVIMLVGATGARCSAATRASRCRSSARSPASSRSARRSRRPSRARSRRRPASRSPTSATSAASRGRSPARS